MTDFDTAPKNTPSVSRMVLYLPDTDEWQRNLVAAIYLLTLPERYETLQAATTREQSAEIGAEIYAEIRFTENHARWGNGIWGTFQWA